MERVTGLRLRFTKPTPPSQSSVGQIPKNAPNGAFLGISPHRFESLKVLGSTPTMHDSIASSKMERVTGLEPANTSLGSSGLTTWRHPQTLVDSIPHLPEIPRGKRVSKNYAENGRQRRLCEKMRRLVTALQKQWRAKPVLQENLASNAAFARCERVFRSQKRHKPPWKGEKRTAAGCPKLRLAANDGFARRCGGEHRFCKRKLAYALFSCGRRRGGGRFSWSGPCWLSLSSR